MKRIQLFLLFVFVLALCACAKKAPLAPAPRATAATLADLRDYPQNLAVFAKAAGASTRLLSAETQEAKTRRFVDIYFGPWHMRKSSISRGEAASVPGARARGYKYNMEPWSQTEWDAMRANADYGSFPSRHGMAAITLRPTSLREGPTNEGRFSKPTPDAKADPFDNFQYSFLPIATPLLVAHTSRDGKWHYVECPISGGWVQASDVAFVDAEFKSEWQRGQYAVLIKDNVPLPGTGQNGKDCQGGIGTVLPLVAKRGGNLAVLVPVKGKNGLASTAEITLTASQAAQMPMPITPGNMAQVGDAMMGQSYGWGGMFGLRDCSSMLRDLFTPFGLWLPRNSRSQAKIGTIISLEGLSPAQKENIIMKDGHPFMSLVGMRGHITLYIGIWKNRPAIFHNVWGLRIVKNGNDDERFVIGRAVITSIAPGMELENLYRPITFADRVRTLTNIKGK